MNLPSVNMMVRFTNDSGDEIFGEITRYRKVAGDVEAADIKIFSNDGTANFDSVTVELAYLRANLTAVELSRMNYPESKKRLITFEDTVGEPLRMMFDENV